MTHVDLDLEADFEAQRLSGTATLHVTAVPGAKSLILDTYGLDIEKVEDQDLTEVPYRLGQPDPRLGTPLIVPLRPGVRRFIVTYSTGRRARALQWLAPQLTAGRQHPFMFTQGQSILTRSWIPTQDSPGIRQTYSARITVPRPLTAVMSAKMLTPKGEATGDGRRAFRFRMEQPIPPYLIALGIGDLAFRPLGPRTGVYAEPVLLDLAASELADTEAMIVAAERLYGPYRWERYDMLVLPPSFPFGGMENPRLTFLTPTMLAGDRSLVSLIAHELAHSWSGNLVTNATWDDIWVNEGFTTYIENRIMEAIYGAARADMLARLGWSDLQKELEALGPDSPDTRLKLDLTGRDPDDGLSQIAYEKGAHFLRTVEAEVGRERFDAWIKGYFDRFAFRPMTTERVAEDLREHLFKGDVALEDKLQLQAWLYQVGVPSNVEVRQSDAFAKVEQAAARFMTSGKASDVPFESWSTQEQLHFLATLPRSMPRARLEALDQAFGLTTRGNSEVLFAWLQLALANRYPEAVNAAEGFLTRMGRRKFVVPILETLMNEGDWGRAHAQRILKKAAPNYHPITFNSARETVYPPPGH